MNFEELVHKITAELTEATKHWPRIGELLKEANIAGVRGKGLRELCKRVGISYPTATKLIRIADSPRINQYTHQLVSIDSWATQYEIVQLDDAEFDAFRLQHLQGGEVVSLSRAQVSKFRQ